jgi:hypothetical protein
MSFDFHAHDEALPQRSLSGAGKRRHIPRRVTGYKEPAHLPTTLGQIAIATI